MLLIEGYQLHQLFEFVSLVQALKEGFQSDINVPDRQHFEFDLDASLLFMPAWQTKRYLGVKLITVLPHNRGSGLPSIQGMYLLFNAETGEPIAQMDAPVLTNYRTAATSALAATYLARADSRSFLMVGTGSLAPYLIRAHLSVRNYLKVSIWGRNPEAAQKTVDALGDDYQVEIVDDLQAAVQQADVISVATLTKSPLIAGDWLRPGTHLDLVGSYRPDMREADNTAVTRSKIYLDTSHAIHESGDMAIPMNQGVINAKDILGTLPDLAKGIIGGRSDDQQITLFKSVGHASEDLIAAVLAYEKFGSLY